MLAPTRPDEWHIRAKVRGATKKLFWPWTTARRFEIADDFDSEEEILLPRDAPDVAAISAAVAIATVVERRDDREILFGKLKAEDTAEELESMQGRTRERTVSQEDFTAAERVAVEQAEAELRRPSMLERASTTRWRASGSDGSTRLTTVAASSIRAFASRSGERRSAERASVPPLAKERLREKEAERRRLVEERFRI